MKLAVIPARGGSKRIPKKNIKLFRDKPIIAWSIIAAQKSKCFDKIIVSTDDDEIAKIATNYNAEVPFKRPKNFSDDTTPILKVVSHAINWFNKKNIVFENVCCIFPTAPFLEDIYIKKGLDILIKKNCDFTFSAMKNSYPIQRSFLINKKGYAQMIDKNNYFLRSQDLDDTYNDAGQFYWGKSSSWTKEKIIFDTNSIPILLPLGKVHDIDTIEDWVYAEKLSYINDMI